MLDQYTTTCFGVLSLRREEPTLTAAANIPYLAKQQQQPQQQQQQEVEAATDGSCANGDTNT